uniref:DM14 domain-containing protein n=1 Tax=Taeniopygia guttata TaxID=59729 RepID=A0A674GMF3_TAEGU
MAAVEALAQLCLRDPPEEEEEEEEEGEEDLENEEELLVRGEVLSLETGILPRLIPGISGAGKGIPPRLIPGISGQAELQEVLEEGSESPADAETPQTLEQMLESVRSGKPIDQAEIPPPVALGKPRAPSAAPSPCPASPSPGPLPGSRLGAGAPPAPPGAAEGSPGAKRRGDNAMALEHFRAAKRLEAQLEALGQGRAPPAPGETPTPMGRAEPPVQTALGICWDFPVCATPEPPRAPRDVREALEQRMERYRAAAGQAKDSGDARKARMHERIVKQYQAALRAHSAGKAVDLSELPVPPGFPPIQGTESPAEPSISGMLEAASRLAAPEQEEEEEEEEEKEDTKAQPSAPPVPPPKQPARNSQAAPKPAGKGTGRAQQQLEFLELRRRQLAQAALRAKRRNDLEGAKLLLRRAKGVEGLLQAARGGLPVDIAQVPEVPLDGAEFELGPARGVPMTPEVAKTFLQLAAALRKQHQMCLTYSRQFAHLGNISETTRCEALAEECRRHMETLRREHGRGGPPPRPRYEQRTFSICSGTPPQIIPDPKTSPQEEAQRDKTNVVKGTDCPEFRARFRLRLLRGHRGLRRLLSSRGIRLEVTQKGGLFRPERALGSVQLRLEGLEGSCELREQLELLDGRRRTGGRLEVWVRIREPLGPQRQLEPRSERWLVLEPAAEPTVTALAFRGAPIPTPTPFPRALPTLPSLNLLLFDRERLERKMVPLGRAGRPVPPELRQQHQELQRRIQGLRARLQGRDPRFRTEYAEHLERHLRLYTEAARRLGTQGEREAAKEALYKRNLVESEVRTWGGLGGNLGVPQPPPPLPHCPLFFQLRKLRG